MAHECPDCGMQCHCNGDIDDCCFDDPQFVNKCKHCEGKDKEESDDNYEE